jgi:hypothetical protein
VSEPSAASRAEAIVHDYFSRLERALAPLPKDRRQQIIDDLRDHVTTALAEGTPASQVPTPPVRRPRWRRRAAGRRPR